MQALREAVSDIAETAGRETRLSLSVTQPKRAGNRAAAKAVSFRIACLGGCVLPEVFHGLRGLPHFTVLRAVAAGRDCRRQIRLRMRWPRAYPARPRCAGADGRSLGLRRDLRRHIHGFRPVHEVLGIAALLSWRCPQLGFSAACQRRMRGIPLPASPLAPLPIGIIAHPGCATASLLERSPDKADWAGAAREVIAHVRGAASFAVRRGITPKGGHPPRVGCATASRTRVHSNIEGYCHD